MRHAFYIFLTTLGLALSLAVIAAAVDLTGLWALLGVTPEAVVKFGLAAGWVGGIACWFMSRSIAAWSLGVRPYDDDDQRHPSGDLTALVARIAANTGLKRPPDLATYDSVEVNAFIVGWRPERSLLVVSTGLLSRLSASEVEPILTQRLLAAANRDISTLILLNGVLNVFTIYPARMLSFMFGTSLRTFTEETPSDVFERAVMRTLEVVVTGLASVAVRHFARGVEQRADQATARLLGEPRFVASLAATEQGTAPRPHREVFVLPLKFMVAQSPRTRWFAYHSPVNARLDELKAGA